MAQFPTGSAKKFVQSLADGYATLTVTNLRKFEPPQLKEMLNNIAVVERESRAEQFEEGDFEGNRRKNHRLANLRRARLVIHGFAKSRRISLS
ncbi:MAG: hypothetical protein H6684_16570 [Deltaproteobacteria bacterium]|nr:hypothetical protein [bacterium]MCB9478688.1 hypothetical protein [Deltaproteobacteria bacterium]MCB9490348.1 hypothetical protein [Deltaproteobacteria bacterium]